MNDNGGCVAVLVIFVVVVAAISLITTCGESPYQSEELIISVSGSPENTGHFGLFYGVIDTEWYYFYMVDMGGGSYRMDKCPADRTIIRENDNVSPRVIKHLIEVHGTLFWIFTISGGGSYANSVEIIVPIGTIIESYNPQGL